ncbi:F-box/kelch-repeat protein At3g27150-like [Vicia villosa]|uniref:F-box/kelch-repeat protein At3g27150-like n=1 Tax=Vicia villosa TaxID=3911 RepID=UPI00273B0CAD|nr:F-box/kelch-repeat protein At3g27150-like [Vicia villosa]
MSYIVSSKRSLPMWSFYNGGSCRNSPNSSNENSRILELSLSSDNGFSPGEEPKDADYVLPLPYLSDEIETMILSRFPISKHWKMCCLNKKYLNVMKSGEIYRMRRMIGLKEPSVFMLASGERNWCVFDGEFKSCKKLPIIPSDYKFEFGVKDSFSAGTHLFVSGMEIDGAVIWRYELTTNEWFKGPSMITPRCAFASASSNTFAYIAGGLETKNCIEILNSAEKYNSENQTWQKLPNMNKKRRFCSGCYLDNKFYVIGGQDENQKNLTCGEFFDEKANKWNLIPNMLKDIILSSLGSPPLIAVVNNELYALDASSNEVKVYVKGKNLWKKLGFVPVRADVLGWGIAFKSLGNELLVIGDSSHTTLMKIYTCLPHHDLEVLEWKQIVCGSGNLNPFIHNCAVMLA